MNELTVVQNFDIAAASGVDQLMHDLREELGADYRPDFAFAKTPSQGMTAWQIKTSDEDEDPEIAKTIDGVILYSHKNFAWWSDRLDDGDGNSQPDCRSNDGVTGYDANGNACDCLSCPRNQFGSDGAGKACKNGRRIYLLRPGDCLPIRIDLAPTGNKPYEKYVDGLLLPRKRGQRPLRTTQVLTRIGLKIATNSGGIKYSVPTFECVGLVPDEARASLLACAESIREAANSAFIPVPDSQIPAEFVSTPGEA